MLDVTGERKRDRIGGKNSFACEVIDLKSVSYQITIGLHI
jgi:hypothetical protein